MMRFSREEILDYLKVVDSFLVAPFEVEMIGGAAGAVSFRLKVNTEDIDTITNVNAIEDVLEAARLKSGLNIPVGVAGVWDGPTNYRRRRKRARVRGLKRLRIYVPDVHDWVLMKVVRFKDKDKEHINEVHKAMHLNKNSLFRRFLSEMTAVIGRPEDLVFNFVSMIEDLFGTKEARRMLKVIRKHKKWKDFLMEEFNPQIGMSGYNLEY